MNLFLKAQLKKLELVVKHMAERVENVAGIANRVEAERKANVHQCLRDINDLQQRLVCLPTITTY